MFWIDCESQIPEYQLRGQQLQTAAAAIAAAAEANGRQTGVNHLRCDDDNCRWQQLEGAPVTMAGSFCRSQKCVHLSEQQLQWKDRK